MINFEAIWAEVKSQFFDDDPYSIHGPEHWHRVEDVGLKIAHLMESAGKLVDRDVVRLFAVLHDSRRESNNHDPGHGRRGAEYAKVARGRLFEISNEQFNLLYRAIEGHADGYTSNDLTIGACWDADRWDLRRLSIEPDPALISIAAMRAQLEPRARR